MADWLMPSSWAMSHTHISDSKSTYRILMRVESPKILNSSARSKRVSSAGMAALTRSTISWCTNMNSHPGAVFFSGIFQHPFI